jgi:hypothetical protein
VPARAMVMMNETVSMGRLDEVGTPSTTVCR